MIVEQAKPSDVAEWFFEVDKKHELLCMFLGVEREDVTRVTDLVHSLNKLDVAMGNKVAFLLFAPFGAEAIALTGREGPTVLGGTFVSPNLSNSDLRFNPIREELPGIQSLNLQNKIHGKEIAEVIAQQSVSFVPELIEEFGLTNATLPAICVLSKTETSPWIIRLSKDWNTAEIKGWLSKLSVVADEQDYDSMVVSEEARNFRSHVGHIEMYAGQIENRRDAILRHLEGLAWRYEGNDRDRLEMVRFFEGGRYSSEFIDEFLSRLSFYNRIDINEKRIQTIVNIGFDISKIEEKIVHATGALENNNSLRSVLERRARVRKITANRIEALVASAKANVFFRNSISAFPAASEVSNAIVRISAVSQRIYEAVKWIKIFI